MPPDSSVKSDEKNEETKKVCHELHDTPYFVDGIFLRFQKYSNTIAQH